MVQKLKSISGRIHLHLLLRSAAFALAWFYLPFWAFLLLALYFYFFPFFQPLKTTLPFAILLYFSAVEAANPWLAVLFGALFYLILGVKDLILIKREAAREVLSLLLTFLLAIKFFLSFGRWDSIQPVFYAALIALLFFFLARAFVPASGDNKRRDIALAVLSFFIWQLLLATLFLPLNFLYQSAIFIVTATALLELVYDHFSLTLNRRKTLLQFSTFFVFIVVILGSAQWGL